MGADSTSPGTDESDTEAPGTVRRVVVKDGDELPCDPDRILSADELPDKGRPECQLSIWYVDTGTEQEGTEDE